MTICFFFLWYFVGGDKMKKTYFLVFLCVFIFFLLFSFSGKKKISNFDFQEERGIFISYIELSKYLKGKSVSDGRKAIREMISNVDTLGFTLILLQVRTFSDAIYPSKIFPWSATVSSEEGVSPGYDILDTFLQYAKKKDMEVYAWINPYRIRGDTDTSDISTLNPAYSYLNTRVVEISDGVFYNPAREESRKLIVSGVEEIVKNYDVDGVLFDDYFYPSTTIDLEEYAEYQKNHPSVSVDEFRLNKVNELVRMVYDVCHQYNVSFGISPDGNIENNYQKHFADVRLWGSEKGYVDFLMPQIYYGFYNESKAFLSVLEEWENISKKVDLLPVLAFYKVGMVDNFAKSGSLEWVENDDIIMREVLLTRNLKRYQGFSLFRYDYLFDKNLQTATTMAEIKNMKKILK